ncbi:MAG: chemotaxis protein CheB [Pseudomonadota bacterium]
MTSQDVSTTTQPPIVVGVGASAGGLEAFQQFMRGLPDQHSMVVVLVQHLDPDHHSMMPELVAAKTKSPVYSVEHNMPMDPGSIYLIPPGYELEIKGERFELVEFESPRGLRRPIDRFFRSLAREHGENAIAVVLSGTGSDGAQGAREVKGAGGLVFVQDPKQAKYDGMPQSVLNQGGADVVSKAEEIVDVVRDYFNLRVGTQNDLTDDDEFLSRLMRHVRFRTGHDFVDYKKGTMMRRVAVRMSVLNMTSPGQYLKYMVENKDEADLLFRDLLINVTSFFRDPEHFDTLAADVIPDLVGRCPEHGEIRAWVAGCSTGEEAYTLAILFAEEVARVNKLCKVVIFGTDIDNLALRTARNGQYADTLVEAVPEALLDRYFRPSNAGYEVGPQLREMVRFSRHSFVKDPPFSKLDLVSCRNVLIYFKENLQETSMKVFHYALVEGGYLFMGPSENPKAVQDYFQELAPRARLYQRRPGPARPPQLGSLSGLSTITALRQEEAIASHRSFTDVERTLLDNHMPPYLHIGRDGEVLYSSEAATRYLKVRAGKMSAELNSMIAVELEPVVRRVVRVGAQSGDFMERSYQGPVNETEARIIIRSNRLADGTVLLTFYDQLQLQERGSENDPASHYSDTYVQELESELDEAREAVRTTVEELETSNEELKSSNEEMMSMNEELQSANEELTTINDELQEKLRELNQVNNDLEHFTASARIATVFLDAHFQLRRYTPEAERYFSFSSVDLGRYMADLNSVIDQDLLSHLCRQTAEDLQLREHEFVTTDQGRSVLARILPYRAEGDEGEGVVFTLQDVTELRRAVKEAQKNKETAEDSLKEIEQIYRTSPMGMGLISTDMKYLRLNEQLAEINGEALDRHLGATIRDIIPSFADEVEGIVREVIKTGKPIRGKKVTGSTRSDPDKERIWESEWVPYERGGETAAVSVTVRDITDIVKTEDTLRRLMGELEHRVKNMLGNVSALVNQARREASVEKDIYDKLTRRIEALAKTHALLTAERWSSAALKDLIGPETVEVYGRERVTLNGPDMRVNSQATLALGMAVHEMATNAAKYGAFSTDTGTVEVSWARINDSGGDRLELSWVERGGPEVFAPEKQGFGSQLIRATLEGTLGGKVTTNWEPQGVTHVIAFDFDTVSKVHEEQ